MPSPWTHALPPNTRAVLSPDPPNDMNGVVDALTAMGAVYNVQNPAWSGGADPTGASDSTAAINAAETAAAAYANVNAAGALVIFPPGQYSVTGLTKQANTIWLGAGRNATIIKLASGSDRVGLLG